MSEPQQIIIGLSLICKFPICVRLVIRHQPWFHSIHFHFPLQRQRRDSSLDSVSAECVRTTTLTGSLDFRSHGQQEGQQISCQFHFWLYNMKYVWQQTNRIWTVPFYEINISWYFTSFSGNLNQTTFLSCYNWQTAGMDFTNITGETADNPPKLIFIYGNTFGKQHAITRLKWQFNCKP